MASLSLCCCSCSSPTFQYHHSVTSRGRRRRRRKRKFNRNPLSFPSLHYSFQYQNFSSFPSITFQPHYFSCLHEPRNNDVQMEEAATAVEEEGGGGGMDAKDFVTIAACAVGLLTGLGVVLFNTAVTELLSSLWILFLFSTKLINLFDLFETWYSYIKQIGLIGIIFMFETLNWCTIKTNY